MNKFKGTYQELKDIILSTGISGTWKECGSDENQKQYKTDSGITLNWWESSKTLQVQGQQGKEKEDFEKCLNEALNNLGNGEKFQTDFVSKKKIFIVHGHDDDCLRDLELFIRRLGLEPYILKNAGESGKTIIEALENNIINDSDFGIVLMTPDDIGASQKKYQEDKMCLQPRARQNVILEMGILIGSIGRHKVAILRKGDLEDPSDVNGILYISFKDSVISEAGNKIIKHLKESGITIDNEKNTDSLL